MRANSGCRDYFEELKEMKTHIKEHHRKDAPAHSSFSYWIVDSKFNKLHQAQLKLGLDFILIFCRFGFFQFGLIELV